MPLNTLSGTKASNDRCYRARLRKTDRKVPGRALPTLNRRPVEATIGEWKTPAVSPPSNPATVAAGPPSCPPLVSAGLPAGRATISPSAGAALTCCSPTPKPTGGRCGNGGTKAGRIMAGAARRPHRKSGSEVRCGDGALLHEPAPPARKAGLGAESRIAPSDAASGQGSPAPGRVRLRSSWLAKASDRCCPRIPLRRPTAGNPIVSRPAWGRVGQLRVPTRWPQARHGTPASTRRRAVP
jgi:hypothetical protein